jgi:signal peptidase I
MTAKFNIGDLVAVKNRRYSNIGIVVGEFDPHDQYNTSIWVRWQSGRTCQEEPRYLILKARP